MKNMKILFTEGTTPFILEALGKSIDDKGFVVDVNKKFVMDADDKKFKAKNLIGVVNKKFITNVFQLNN